MNVVLTLLLLQQNKAAILKTSSKIASNFELIHNGNVISRICNTNTPNISYKYQMPIMKRARSQNTGPMEHYPRGFFAYLTNCVVKFKSFI